MDKYDLLDKLIEEHIEELKRLCELEAETDTLEGSATWFLYFEQHYSFFSAMLTSKGAPFSVAGSSILSQTILRMVGICPREKTRNR